MKLDNAFALLLLMQARRQQKQLFAIKMHAADYGRIYRIGNNNNG